MSKTRRYKVPVFPVAEGAAYQQRVQVLIGNAGGRVWETVNTKRPAVAERILLMRRTDGEPVRLVQR